MEKKLSNTQKVFKGISSQTLVTLILGLVEILYFSIMSRLLSREDFGFFAAISAITVIFSSISEAGIGAAVIQKKDMSEEYKNTAFSLSLIIGVSIALLMCLTSGFIANLIMGDKTLQVPLMLMSVTIIFHGLISINISWMQRHLKFIKAGFIKLASFVLSSAIAIYLAWDGYGFYAILVRAILSSFLVFIISYLLVGTKFKFVLHRGYISSIASYGGWLTASVIVRNFAQQTDRLLMSRLLSVSALGAYNRPKEFITQIAKYLNGIFDTALFPVLSSIQDNKQSLRNAFNSSQYYMNMFSMFIALSFICNSFLLIRIFLGEEWLDLNTIFILLSLSVVFNVNGRLGDCYLRSLAMVKQQTFFRIFQLFINVVAMLIGYQWGIVGVAISFVTASFLNILIKTIYISLKLDIPVRKTALNIFDSWRYSVFFIPIIVVENLINNHSVTINILFAVIFILVVFFVFLLYPKLVGTKYKNEAYAKVMQKIKMRLKTKEK